MICVTWGLLLLATKSVKCVPWKSTIRILFPFSIFHQLNKDTNQASNEDQEFCFCQNSEKSRLECLNNAVSRFYKFLEFFLCRCFSSTFLLFTMILFTQLLNSCRASSVRLWPKQGSRNFQQRLGSWQRLEYSSRI